MSIMESADERGQAALVAVAKAGLLEDGRRIRWNPTGEVWEPGTVLAEDASDGGLRLKILLDENRQVLWVDARHCRWLPDLGRTVAESLVVGAAAADVL